MSPPMSTLEGPKRDIEKIQWYHTLDLGNGVVTDGWFDLRESVEHYGLPSDMSGLRALDIGTWDGFWAFEMERRGAVVTALDVDDDALLDTPPRLQSQSRVVRERGSGFRLAKQMLGSKVERVPLSIYEATPEVLGTFDLVFCGSVLIHLRDQSLALERIARLCNGLFISAEEYSRSTDLVPFPIARYRAHRDKAVVFWQPNRRAWRSMYWAAGFEDVGEVSRFTMESTDGFSVRHAVHHCRGSIFSE